jgi:hypothetical protein
MRSAFFLLPAFLLAFISSCTTDPDLSKAPDISYSRDVSRIMSSHCNFRGCHGGGEGEFSLETYNDVLAQVKAGDARGSSLYQVITRRGFVEERMPPSGYAEVRNEDVKLIYLWIEQGAKNN